jgi:hypothetical protein
MKSKQRMKLAGGVETSFSVSSHKVRMKSKQRMKPGLWI